MGNPIFNEDELGRAREFVEEKYAIDPSRQNHKHSFWVNGRLVIGTKNAIQALRLFVGDRFGAASGSFTDDQLESLLVRLAASFNGQPLFATRAKVKKGKVPAGFLEIAQGELRRRVAKLSTDELVDLVQRLK